MKTPRELLFARHQSAEPKLERIRHKVVQDIESHAPMVCAKESKPQSLFHSFRELLLSSRWHLAGLSAAWLLIGFINHEKLAGPSDNSANSLASTQRLLAAMRENRRQIIELLGTESVEPAASATRPRRRSERSLPHLISGSALREEADFI